MGIWDFRQISISGLGTASRDVMDLFVVLEVPFVGRVEESGLYIYGNSAGWELCLHSRINRY